LSETLKRPKKIILHNECPTSAEKEVHGTWKICPT